MRTAARSNQSGQAANTQSTSRDSAVGNWLRARSEGAVLQVQRSTNAAQQPMGSGGSRALPDVEIAAVTRAAITRVELSGRSPQLPAFKVHGMQKWDGRVLDVDDGVFSAELTPHEPDGQPVAADFSLDLLLPETDVQPGDLIYVTARTVVDRPGFPPSRTVSVRLRRLGNWTVEDALDVRRRAEAASKRYDHLFE